MPPKRRTAQEQLPRGHGKKNKTKNSAADVNDENESDIDEKPGEVEEDEEEIQVRVLRSFRRLLLYQGFTSTASLRNALNPDGTGGSCKGDSRREYRRSNP